MLYAFLPFFPFCVLMSLCRFLSWHARLELSKYNLEGLYLHWQPWVDYKQSLNQGPSITGRESTLLQEVVQDTVTVPTNLLKKSFEF